MLFAYHNGTLVVLGRLRVKEASIVCETLFKGPYDRQDRNCYRQAATTCLHTFFIDLYILFFCVCLDGVFFMVLQVWVGDRQEAQHLWF